MWWPTRYNQATLRASVKGGCLSVHGRCALTELGSPVVSPPRALSTAPCLLLSSQASASRGPFCFSNSLRSLPMAKRAARRAKLHAIENDRGHTDRVHSLVFARTPPANDRDQSYVRKVRPRSDNQRLLMEAIESKPLTIAVGPAGKIGRAHV